MNIQKFSKEQIARQQIETALALYFEGRDLFSVITLAGAAEEILGQLLPAPGGEGKHPLTSLFRILRPKSAREQKKQGLTGHEDDNYLHMDLKKEAVFLLGRAIEDYQALTGALSSAMLKFKDQLAGE